MLLVEEVLIVEASAERGARVLHISGAAVAKAFAVGTATHRGQRGTCTFHRHGVDLCGEVQGIHIIELVAE